MMKHSLLIVAVVALVTALIRFLPFLVFGNRKQPAWLVYFSAVLPGAMIAMLVVYCLRNVSFTSGSRGIPEAVSCLAVAALHVWKRNTLLSILVGTILYMVLVQMVFS